jgi:phage shock protein E
MRKLAYLFVVGILVSACGAVDVAEATGLRTVSADDAQAVIEAAGPDVVVLDIRTPEEFAEGHIEGALNIDFYAPDFTEQLAALDPEADYVLYCRSDNRSGQAMPMLEDLGFGAVAEVDGGILAWEQAGLPVSR